MTTLRIRIPLTPLNKIIISIGIDSHQFRDYFDVVESTTAYPVVYGGEESMRSSMLVKPNKYAYPKVERARDLFNSYAGRVLVPDRIWWDTAHVIAIYSIEPVLSNIFYAVKLKVPGDVREYAEKALVLWLNTTWGILTVLFNREETRGRWTRLKMSQWRLLKVLDVTALDLGTLNKLAEVFGVYASKEPRRIPEQFDPPKPDTLRLGIDRDFIKVLIPSISSELLEKKLRELYRHVHTSLTQWIGG